MRKVCLIIIWTIAFFNKNAKSQVVCYVENDTTDLAIKKALGFFKRDFCSIETHNFQSFLKSKERNIYYRVFKNENGKQFQHFLPEFTTILERGKEFGTLKSDCRSYPVNFVKRSFKKFDSLKCYLSIVHLLRKGPNYYLTVRANETESKDKWFQGWDTTFIFTFDERLALQRVNYVEGLRD